MLAIEYFDRAVTWYPDRVAVEDDKLSLTFSEMSVLVDRIAGAIIRAGLKPGSHITILSSNHPHVLACQYAIIRAGCVWIPANPRNSVADTVRQLHALEVEWMFFHADFEPQVSEILKEYSGLEGLVCMAGRSDQRPSIEDWISDPVDLSCFPERKMDDHIVIMPTGGTTGLPKGAIHTNRSWEGLIAAFYSHCTFRVPPVHLVVAPLTHAAGGLHWTMVGRGAKHVICPSADPGTILRMIDEHKITVIFLPPTLIYMLLAHPDVGKYDYSSLEYFFCGSAPISVDKLREAATVFGFAMSQGYGQTETLMGNTFLTREDLTDALANPTIEHRIASVGREGPFCRIGIMNDEGVLLSPNTHGEIVVRSETVMAGYYNDPVRTAETRLNGWHRTGDIGYIDDDGYIYLVDRKNDMIISGGFNVYPAEVERAVLAHPAVQDCAVVGIPHEKWGEAVLAAVQLKPGEVIEEDEFFAFCKERIGSVKTPKYLKLFDELPRSAVGKILRRVVREPYWVGRDRAI